MHEIIFRTDDNIKAYLTASINVPVYAAMDSAVYDPKVLPPYVIVNTRMARGEDAHDAENYYIETDIQYVINLQDFNQTVRDNCNAITDLLVVNSAPASLTTNGLHVDIIGGSPNIWRREIEDSVVHFVGTIELQAHLTS
jgi:hypothetical protein